MGWLGKSFFKLILVLVFFSASQVLVFKYINPPGTVNMVWERLLSRLNQTEYISPLYSWQDLEKISPTSSRPFWHQKINGSSPTADLTLKK